MDSGYTLNRRTLLLLGFKGDSAQEICSQQNRATATTAGLTMSTGGEILLERVLVSNLAT